MTAARKITVTLGAKPLRVAPPQRRFAIWRKADAESGCEAFAIDGAVVTGVDEIAALHAWAKAEGVSTRDRRVYEARELPAVREETEAEEDAREARFDALGDQIDEERDAQRWERDDRDEDEMPGRADR